MNKNNEHLDKMVQALTKELEKAGDVEHLLKCISNEDYNLNLLQWRLQHLMTKQTDENIADLQIFECLISDVEILELLLCSGYVQDHR